VLNAGRNALIWAGAIKEVNPDLANQAGASDAAAQAALFYANHARIAGDSAAVAATQVDQLTAAQLRQAAAQGLADQRAGERAPGGSGRAEAAAEDERRAQNVFRRLAQPAKDKAAADAKAAADKAAQDADRLADLRNQNRLINAKTTAQKLAELERQKAATTDPIERQQIQNQIDQEGRGGKARVDKAQTTALQLQNVEENSQLQLLKTQREGQERLRDAQLDFDIKRARGAEDFQEEYRKLLAKGQRAQAEELKRDFEKDQRRAVEDFQLQQRRTVRNNGEGVSDIGARTDLRQVQIGDRAALRNGGATVGGIPTPTGGAAAQVGTARTPTVIQLNMPSAIYSPDGQKLGDIVYPFVSQRLDDDLSIEIRSAPTLGGNQVAVSGTRP
jgi:hypothetical protein